MAELFGFRITKKTDEKDILEPLIPGKSPGLNDYL